MHFFGGYPHTRLRRLRQKHWIRNLVQETSLSADDFIMPVFVCPPDHPRDIEGLPGIKRQSLQELPFYVEEIFKLGIPAIMLFPIVDRQLKSATCEESFNPDNLLCQAVHLIKRTIPQLGVITDVALDPYTLHGHDGILINDDIANDPTLEVLCKQALCLAQAGADAVAPSDMMDGRIQAIRKELDAHNYQQTMIFSYSVKFASSFYGPFRNAVKAMPLKGLADKKTYQISPCNASQSLREVAQDIEEGADIIIIKPGLPYLDILQKCKELYAVPFLSYHVSGEYAMLKAATLNRWINEKEAFLETLIAFKRAGASGIITYAAMEAAQWIIE